MAKKSVKKSVPVVAPKTWQVIVSLETKAADLIKVLAKYNATLSPISTRVCRKVVGNSGLLVTNDPEKCCFVFCDLADFPEKVKNEPLINAVFVDRKVSLA